MNRERVIFDTNVLISFALNATTTPAQAVEYALNHCDILYSPATLTELVTRLLQSKFDRYITLEQRRVLLSRLIQHSVLINPTYRTIQCRDSDDNRFLELAVSGQVRYLVTGDKDLLVLQRYAETDIVTSVQFLELTRQ